MPTNMEEICLKHDNGKEFCFHGRLFSECSHFDEENSCLTRQQLFVTDKGEQVYYIIRSMGQERQRSAYRLSVRDDICHIHNGLFEIALPIEHLLLAVRSLCGISAESLSSLDEMEDMLRAANS